MASSTRLSRRTFITWIGGTGACFYLMGRLPGSGQPVVFAHVPGGTLDPTTIPKFQTPMLIPPAMPRAAVLSQRGGKPIDYYEISMRQFVQQILPPGFNPTTVWGYGGKAARSNRGLLVHNAPSLTIEATWKRPVRIKWVNELVDANGEYLPHLLPVDPTLHWANPAGGADGRDSRPSFAATPGPYTGPVPMVTHVHGAVGVADDSDGYAEAWYLPNANIPAGHANEGRWYNFFAAKAAAAYGVSWEPGSATFQYPNANRASTLWYHDHALGLTRLNVYAGPAGFYLVRGGPDDAVVDQRSGGPAILPGPAPREGDKFPPTKPYREIPVAIQDRSFDADGSLFYPDTRQFFDGIVGHYIPHGEFSPIWNPEFYGNTIIVNGSTWPFLSVEQRRYRFRFLNGCQSRFLVLDFGQVPGVDVWQIGNEGGYLAAPVHVTGFHDNRILMGPAERADVIVDFTNVPVGSYALGNVGPDEPFGGGVPGVDFDTADQGTTGQIMQFRVVPAIDADDSTPPSFLQLPVITPLPAEGPVRRLALVEKSAEGASEEQEEIEGPVEALLGTVDAQGNVTEYKWADAVTENPTVGTTEVWEIYNTTADAHPMHIHEVVFEVVNREGLVLDGDGEVVQPIQPNGDVRFAEEGESGFKDTVIAYPGQVTRLRMRFTTPGQYVWHCHIVEHEDNEMMRPYRIGPPQPGQPG